MTPNTLGSPSLISDIHDLNSEPVFYVRDCDHCSPMSCVAGRVSLAGDPVYGEHLSRSQFPARGLPGEIRECGRILFEVGYQVRKSARPIRESRWRGNGIQSLRLQNSRLQRWRRRGTSFGLKRNGPWEENKNMASLDPSVKVLEKRAKQSTVDKRMTMNWKYH